MTLHRVNAVGRYVRRHHLALFALFVALGGTSYAALRLPRGSVGTRQIRDRAVTLRKISRRARHALHGAQGPRGAIGPAGGSRGATGARGSRGPKGSTGGKGSTGARGPVGPTVGALGGGGAPPALGALPKRTLASTSITTPATGALVATGLPSRAVVQCPAGVGCTVHLALYLDGAPMPGSDETFTGAAGATSPTFPPVQARASGVPAGAHTVSELLVETTGAGFELPLVGASPTLSAVALGG